MDVCTYPRSDSRLTLCSSQGNARNKPSFPSNAHRVWSCFVVASSSILGRDQHNCYFAENRSRRSSANNTIEREDEILLGEGEEFTMPAQQADHPVCVWMSFGQTDDLFLPSPQKRGRQEGRGQLRHKTRASREEATRMEVSFSR